MRLSLEFLVGPKRPPRSRKSRKTQKWGSRSSFLHEKGYFLGSQGPRRLHIYSVLGFLFFRFLVKGLWPHFGLFWGSLREALLEQFLASFWLLLGGPFWTHFFKNQPQIGHESARTGPQTKHKSARIGPNRRLICRNQPKSPTHAQSVRIGTTSVQIKPNRPLGSKFQRKGRE